MTCSDVKLVRCRLCGKAIASDLGACIHCGVCNPVADEKCSWVHRVVFILLIVGTILLTIRYDDGRRVEPDCLPQEIGRMQGC